jgi:hypothetical protein
VTAAWSETSDGGALVITFDGIDADRRDKAELAAFMSDLNTPADDDDWEGHRSSARPFFDARRTTSPTQAMRVTFLCVLGFVTGWLAIRIGGAVAGWLGRELSGGTQLVLLFLGFVAPLTAAIAREWSARRRNHAAPAMERFSLRLDPSGLTATGERGTTRTFALESVDGFEGGPRLGVRLRDGTRARLRCVLPLVRDHASLAARLDEALRQVRTANADYRGTPRVRVATLAPELDADEPGEGEDEGHAAATTRRTDE